MIILDTDAVSDLMRPQPSPTLVKRLSETAPDDQATTSITVGELVYGAHKADRPELFERATALLAGVRVFDFDRAAAERYGQLRASLERSGQRLADPDLRIAAVALVRRAALISGNVRHFARIPDLVVQDWIRETG